MKKTRLLMCLMLVAVMLFGSVQAFAAEGTVPEETTAAEETTPAEETSTPAVDDSVCPKTDDGKHVFEGDGTKWRTDSEMHGRYCTKCRTQIGKEPHSFGEMDENHQYTCSVCGKKKDAEHEHAAAVTWSSNAYVHWHACENTFGLTGQEFCQEKVDETDHTWNAEGVCTVCGFKDVLPAERPGDAGINWTLLIVLAGVGVVAAAAVLLIKKKK